MKSVCRCYSNPVRLCLVLSKMQKESCFRYYVISGIVNKTKDSFNCHGEKITVLVTYTDQEEKKQLSLLLTTDSSYNEFDKALIDFSGLEQSNVFYKLCCYMKDRAESASNPFSIGFGGNKCNVVVTYCKATGMYCIVSSTDGEIKTSNPDIIEKVLSDCTELQSFSYNVVTSDYEKEVMVRKNQYEIYRECSRYIGKTLALLALDSNGELVEQYISPIIGLEIKTVGSGKRAYTEVSLQKMSKLNHFCIYLSNATISEIAREQGRALNKKNIQNVVRCEVQ